MEWAPHRYCTRYEVVASAGDDCAREGLFHDAPRAASRCVPHAVAGTAGGAEARGEELFRGPFGVYYSAQRARFVACVAQVSGHRVVTYEDVVATHEARN